MSEFDPDAYLREKTAAAAPFDPDAYLREKAKLTGTEAKPAEEKPGFLKRALSAIVQAAPHMAKGAAEMAATGAFPMLEPVMGLAKDAYAEAEHGPGAALRRRKAEGAAFSIPALVGAGGVLSDALYRANHPHEPFNKPFSAGESFRASRDAAANKNDALAAEFPDEYYKGQLGLGAALAPLAPIRAAQGASLLTRALASAGNAGIFGGAQAAGSSRADSLADFGKDVGGGVLLGGALGGLGTGAAGLAQKAAPLLKRAAGALKVSSLRPTPTLAEAMEDLPGGKAGVGQALLERKIGGITKNGTAKQIKAALDSQGEEIGGAIERADRAAGTPNLTRTPGGDYYTSGTGDPAELAAAAEKMAKEAVRDGRYVLAPQEPEVPPAAGTRAEGRLRAVKPPPLPRRVVETLPGGPDAKAPDVTAVVDDARQGLRPRLLEPSKSAVGAAGRDADALLAEYSEQYRPEPAGFKTAHEFKRKLGDEIYGAGREAKTTQNALKREYAKALNESYGKVEQAIQRKMEALDPALAAKYRSGNLDFRRLVHASAAADRLAGRVTSNHLVGLPDLLAGDLVSGEGAGPLGKLATATGWNMLRRYGPQAGARGLYSLGSALEGGSAQSPAVEALRGLRLTGGPDEDLLNADPKLLRQAALIAALRSTGTGDYR